MRKEWKDWRSWVNLCRGGLCWRRNNMDLCQKWSEQILILKCQTMRQGLELDMRVWWECRTPADGGMVMVGGSLQWAWPGIERTRWRPPPTHPRPPPPCWHTHMSDRRSTNTIPTGFQCTCSSSLLVGRNAEGTPTHSDRLGSRRPFTSDAASVQPESLTPLETELA